VRVRRVDGVRFAGVLGLFWFLLSVAWAQPRPENTADGQSSVTPQSAASSGTPGNGESGDGEAAPATTRRKGGRQAEGTEAPNKFEADPVVKSRYMMEGRTLEVDPD